MNVNGCGKWYNHAEKMWRKPEKQAGYDEHTGGSETVYRPCRNDLVCDGKTLCPTCVAELEADRDGWKAERNMLIEMTRKLDEHPEGYDGPCLCKLCMSYGVQDNDCK